MNITIYADGACKGTKIGGWGVHLQSGDHVKEIFGGKADTTNNQMELQAPIEAIKALKRPCKGVTIHTDSNYVVQGITTWIHKWITNGRLEPSGDLKNKELWKELYHLAYECGHEIKFKWVKGHVGIVGNERADYLANKGCQSAGWNGTMPTY